MRLRLCLALLAPSLVMCSCDPDPESPVAMEKRPTGHYTGHLIEKPFIDKAGRPAGGADLYLRLSMGDYFIKFSESSVTREDLAIHVGSVVSLAGEIRDGDWDIGPGDPPEMQSRIGPYFVVSRIVGDENLSPP